MVKITLITNNPKEVDIVNERMTVRDFLEKHNVNYGIASTSIDGCPLDTVGLDTSFAEHGVTEKAIISCLPNKDNGVQAVIVGSTCVIKSELTPEQIDRVKKLEPDLLVLKDDNGEPIFAVDIDHEGPGSINSVGACFGNAASSDGKATITILIDPQVEDTEEFVFDHIGHELNMLDYAERSILSNLPAIEDRKNRVMQMITKI